MQNTGLSCINILGSLVPIYIHNIFITYTSKAKLTFFCLHPILLPLPRKANLATFLNSLSDITIMLLS